MPGKANFYDTNFLTRRHIDVPAGGHAIDSCSTAPLNARVQCGALASNLKLILKP